jgi:hypothetical protein
MQYNFFGKLLIWSISLAIGLDSHLKVIAAPESIIESTETIQEQSQTPLPSG